MKFEQAFYTRGKDLLNENGIGLGIAASSNSDRQFLDSCMSIGGNFNTERSEETAQFVFYSEVFKVFVGVGISPPPNRDGGGVNKLCHFFIPVKEERNDIQLDNPESYYLTYPFQRTAEKKDNLSQIELNPCLSMDDYFNILEKYQFSREKLAYFLSKLYPILFSEKNCLLILLNDVVQGNEEKFAAAREITWLASRLVPGTGEDARQYRKRLSYGVVNTKTNIAVVSITYAFDESFNENQFYLGREAGSDIPDVYFFLAEKALKSPSDYLEGLEEISKIMKNSRQDKLDNKTLTDSYFYWKVDQGKTIYQRELPRSLDQMIRDAQRSEEKRERLKKIVFLLDDVDVYDLNSFWDRIIIKELRDENKEREDMLDYAVRAINLMYEKSRDYYQKFLRELPPNVSSTIMEKLYSSENSCIAKHLKEIKTIDDFRKINKLYQALNKNTNYRKFMENKFDECLKEMKIEDDLRKNLVSIWEDYDTEDYQKNLKCLWKNCEDNISKRIQYSLVFNPKRYSIWTSVRFDDIEKFEEIWDVLEREPKFSPIETTRLTGEEKKSAEYSRIYYCLWKDICKENSEEFFQLMRSPTVENHLSEFSKEVFSFLENLSCNLNNKKKYGQINESSPIFKNLEQVKLFFAEKFPSDSIPETKELKGNAIPLPPAEEEKNVDDRGMERAEGEITDKLEKIICWCDDNTLNKDNQWKTNFEELKSCCQIFLGKIKNNSDTEVNNSKNSESEITQLYLNELSDKNKDNKKEDEFDEENSSGYYK